MRRDDTFSQNLEWAAGESRSTASDAVLAKREEVGKKAETMKQKRKHPHDTEVFLLFDDHASSRTRLQVSRAGARTAEPGHIAATVVYTYEGFDQCKSVLNVTFDAEVLKGFIAAMSEAWQDQGVGVVELNLSCLAKVFRLDVRILQSEDSTPSLIVARLRLDFASKGRIEVQFHVNPERGSVRYSI